MSRSVIEEVSTEADGFGLWLATVEFTHALSESDPRREFNLQAQLSNIRRAARKAIIDEIVAREQKMNESESAARARVSISLGRLHIIDSDVDAMNRWHSITLSEDSGNQRQSEDPVYEALQARSNRIVSLLKELRTSQARTEALGLATQIRRRIGQIDRPRSKNVPGIIDRNAELYDLIDREVSDAPQRRQLTTEISDLGRSLELLT